MELSPILKIAGNSTDKLWQMPYYISNKDLLYASMQ